MRGRIQPATLSYPGPFRWLDKALRAALVSILVILPAACTPVQAGGTPLAVPSTATHTALPSPQASSTDRPKPEATLAPQVSPSPVPTVNPTAVPESIEFVYPTHEPVPIADWRPPLYPTPWAPTLHDHFYFASPIAADEINIPVQDYRYGGIFFENVVHTGIDIPAPRGTPVHAAGPGIIIWAGYGVYREGYDTTDPYGLAVTIRHDFGYQNQALYTVYGHLDRVDVAEGQHVDTGTVLGLVGQTGTVTGPHLHFEVRLGDNSFFTTRNPELWLVPPVGWGVIAGRVTDNWDQLLSDQMFIITDPKTETNSFAWTYGKTTVNSDQYYVENLVVGDIPAGTYLLRFAYAGMYFNREIDVYPGMVSYFTFHGFDGITIEGPPSPGLEFTPSPLSLPLP